MDEVGPKKPSNPGENVGCAPATPPSQWQTSLINLSSSFPLRPAHRTFANQPRQEFITKGLGHLSSPIPSSFCGWRWFYPDNSARRSRRSTYLLFMTTMFPSGKITLRIQQRPHQGQSPPREEVSCIWFNSPSTLYVLDPKWTQMHDYWAYTVSIFCVRKNIPRWN